MFGKGATAMASIVAAQIAGLGQAISLRQSVQSQVLIQAESQVSLLKQHKRIVAESLVEGGDGSDVEDGECGNGIRDHGEQCDGGPCCKDDCTNMAVGTACSLPMPTHPAAFSGVCFSGDCVSLEEQCSAALEAFGETWAGHKASPKGVDPEPCTEEMQANPCKVLLCKTSGACHPFSSEAEGQFVNVEPGSPCGDGKVCWAGACFDADQVAGELPVGKPRKRKAGKSLLRTTSRSLSSRSQGWWDQPKYAEVFVLVDRPGLDMGWNAAKIKEAFQWTNTAFTQNSHLDVHFVVTDARVTESSFGDDAEAALIAFTDWMVASGRHYDNAMLLTGRDLVGSTVGIAYVRTQCRNLATSVVQVRSDERRTFTTIAHELGHNMHMNHDFHDSCSGESNFLMGYDAYKRQEFSSCSKSQFFANIHSWSCFLNRPVDDALGLL